MSRSISKDTAMKFRIRKPSLKKKLAARTSLKRFVRHQLGRLKAPEDMAGSNRQLLGYQLTVDSNGTELIPNSISQN